MKVFLVIWSIVIMVAIILTGVMVTKNYIYQGEDIQFKTKDRDIQIETTNTKIEIEGVSGDYFQLKKSNEILYSIPKTAPLGYEDKDYFILERQLISEGKWSIKQNESISLHLKNEEYMVVTTIRNSKLITWLGVIFLGALLWFLIVLGVYSITEN